MSRRWPQSSSGNPRTLGSKRTSGPLRREPFSYTSEEEEEPSRRPARSANSEVNRLLEKFYQGQAGTPAWRQRDAHQGHGMSQAFEVRVAALPDMDATAGANSEDSGGQQFEQRVAALARTGGPCSSAPPSGTKPTAPPPTSNG